MRRLTLLPAAAALGSALLLAAACGGGENTAATGPAAPTDDTTASTATGDTTTGGTPAAAKGVDPREGGFEIALGEWALTPEAESIRPGRVTFVITNRGTMPHGFEIEREDGDDSSGSGSGDDRDKVETRILQPGESVSVDLNSQRGCLQARVQRRRTRRHGHGDALRGQEGRAAGEEGGGSGCAAGRCGSRGRHPRVRLRARPDRGGRGPGGHLDEPRPGSAHRHPGGRRVRLRERWPPTAPSATRSTSPGSTATSARCTPA